MKKFLVFSVIFMMFSCAKKETKKVVVSNEKASVAPYDTIAVDSFSAGAVSVDVARKIKMSSIAYQDSLKEIRKRLEAEKLLQKEKEVSDKTTKKAEEDLKKAEAAKLKKEKEKSGTDNPVPDHLPKP